MKTRVLLIADGEISVTFYDDTRSDGSFDQELLEAISNGDAFIFKAETIRGQQEFCKALVDIDESDVDTEPFVISDWELV